MVIERSSGLHLVLCLAACLVTIRAAHAQSTDLEAIAESVARYETVLAADPLVDDGSQIIEVQRLLPLLPETVAQLVLVSDSVHLTTDTRDAILGWWRTQDPLPASEVNERMMEHVRRVEYALKHYVCITCPVGYDARGEIYVRYGAPERITRIVFDDPLLIDAIYQPGVAVSPGDFPENEFWRYLNIDRDAYFLFVQDGKPYRLGDTYDLLPIALRSGLGQGGRGLVKSRMVLAAMRSIYRQLALEHYHFGSRFNEVDRWLAAHEGPGRLQSRDVTENAKIIAGANLLTQGERPEAMEFDQDLGQPAHIFAQGMITNARIEDDQAAYQKEILLPPSTSDVLSPLRTLPLGIRYARFLEPDGTTTTEIYWHPEPGGLIAPGHGSEPVYFVQIYAAQERADHTLRHSSSDAIRIQIPSFDEPTTIPVQTIRVTGDTGLYHLALQWDQYGINAEELGPRLQVTSRRIDSLRSLDASGFALEMSDLKPIVYTESGAPMPWPHNWVTPDMRFGLDFEIYHLTYGAQDATSYTVTYEVAPERRRTSSTSVEYEGQSRMEGIEVAVDIGRRTGKIQIRVRVRDEVSGLEVSRLLNVEMR
ncbi:MAG: GWxTD domain-containing protein [Rhodothermaceae bacterium]|nr:GWxTD domain-containing protein [Rhodothermaceae bacterium]MXZ05507.1 GWxTD domain-containing protein [Rhodothermaceae bacterium]MYD18972.1 GWxTD domain-containing protein [Rhodothermaceae bacterium]MYF41422.1 GWxTD domain-containing protein [Rhodothermaceae bacterium]